MAFIAEDRAGSDIARDHDSQARIGVINRTADGHAGVPNIAKKAAMKNGRLSVRVGRMLAALPFAIALLTPLLLMAALVALAGKLLALL